MTHVLKAMLVLMWIAIGISLYIAWLIFNPVRTIVINNFSYTDPIYIETPVVHAGDVVKYQLDYCKFTDITPTSKGQLIDGQIIALTPAQSSSSGLPIGCHKTERTVTIPDTVNPGRYYLNKELDYQVNPLRTEKVQYYTQYFQVVPKSLPSTSAPPANNETSSVPSPLDISATIR